MSRQLGDREFVAGPGHAGVPALHRPARMAEIGFDTRRSSSAAHLASWAGMCPDNQESASRPRLAVPAKPTSGSGQRRSDRPFAWPEAGAFTFAAQYRRLTARRGKKKAAVALGHSIPVIVYHCSTRRGVTTTSESSTSTRPPRSPAARIRQTPTGSRIQGHPRASSLGISIRLAARGVHARSVGRGGCSQPLRYR